VIPAIAFRVQAYLFQRRVNRLMSGLSGLRIGETSKAETLARVPGLSGEPEPVGQLPGTTDQYLSIALRPTWVATHLLLRSARGDHQEIYAVLHLWGIRHWEGEVDVIVSDGKVSGLGYRMILSTPKLEYPNALSIAASSRRRFPRPSDENLGPAYEVSHYFKRPLLDTYVYFNSQTAPELLSHAFRPQLQCLWSIPGCRTANEVLPEAEEDRIRMQTPQSQ
jgi:hypothetical protein